jgi:hypothetical protein
MNFHCGAVVVGFLFALIGIYYPIVSDIVNNGATAKGAISFVFTVVISMLGAGAIWYLLSREDEGSA